MKITRKAFCLRFHQRASEDARPFGVVLTMGDLGIDSLLADGNSYEFGAYTLDPRRRTVARGDSLVSLTPKAFDVLYYLVRNPNRLVTKEELLGAVWADMFVEEGNLTQYISHLRKALDDNTEDARLIATIARKGYQFTERVVVVSSSQAAENGTDSVTSVVPASENHTPLASDAAARSSSGSASSGRPQQRKWVVVGALLLAAAALSFYSLRFQRVKLSAYDTVVVGDIQNDTNDPLFDDALSSPVHTTLEQTPYLNILGADKINGTLAQLKLPSTTRLTSLVARQVCTRTNSRLIISTSIRDAGNGYLWQMLALDCVTGKTLAREQARIAARNEVVHELGETAARLRAGLGESADSLARFNQPLEIALSPNLEALQAGRQGFKVAAAGDPNGALNLFQRAVELDPKLGVAWQDLGAMYLVAGENELSSAAYTRAYELRDRLTEKSRLSTEITYDSNVIGDWEKEYDAVQRMLQIFPRDVFAHSNLRAAFIHLGEPGRAADEATEIARRRPNAYYYGGALQSIRYASRFNEAKEWLAKADALKFDSLLIRRERLIVTFATGDNDGAEKILEEEEQGSHREDFLHEHSLIEIQRGRFQSAAHLRQQAAALATKPGSSDWWTTLSAIENAEVGRDVQPRPAENVEREAKQDYTGDVAMAFALARAGKIDEAGKIADAVSVQNPADTLVQRYFVPTIRAAIALRKRDPAAAIEALRDTTKYDLAFTGTYDYVYPAYLRGLAYLELHDGRSAAAQFQKQLDNPGFGVRHVIGPLAWLQLGRAQKMNGDNAAARKSYETFLNFWKNADPDIPIYRQAQAEYANLPK